MTIAQFFTTSTLNNYCIMTTVRHLLQHKGYNSYTVTPHATVYEALELMAEKNIGAVMVVDDEKLVGIFSERDYARKVVLQGKNSRDTKMEELMTKNVFYIKPHRTVKDCMVLMSKKHIRHLPVMENGNLIGIVTIRDVVDALIYEQENTIEELERYITRGGGYVM